MLLPIFVFLKSVNFPVLTCVHEIILGDYVSVCIVTVVQLPSHVWLSPWTAAWQAPLSFTISLSLLKFMSIEWCHPAISSSLVCSFSCSQSFPASGIFPVSLFFTSGGQSIGASASASVLPMNIQGWFPWGLTGLISLLSKGLSRVFSNTSLKASVS